MRQGAESRTAIATCLGRAVAHGRTSVARFDDPLALRLLPEKARVRVEQLREGKARPIVARALEGAAKMMIARTVAIDDALRDHPRPQIVLLGAGLDSRAWRIRELGESTIFEVDHPDSQKAKRERLGDAPALARAVKFVPVDFTRDDLDLSLQTAGHDPSLPTAWVWEGVVMYLTREQIESTLRVIGKRSAPGSKLLILYRAPGGLLSKLTWGMMRLTGEPFLSKFTASEMQQLLAKFGFEARDDDDLPTLADRIGAPDLGDPTRYIRLVDAVRG